MISTRKKIAAGATAVLTATALITFIAPAQASEFSITADQTSNLARSGAVVNVTVNNLSPTLGIYLRLCAGTAEEAARARLTNCVSMAETIWTTANRAALAQGAVALTGPVALKVPSTFTSATGPVDCTVASCGISSRRDHLGGATDFTLDRFVPVTFAQAAVAKTRVQLRGSRVIYRIVDQMGERITFNVGSRKFTRVARSDNFVFRAPAPSDRRFVASAFIGNQELLSRTIRR